MALPFSRNTTYVDGLPVKSGDLNDIQDNIVSNHLLAQTFLATASLPTIAPPPWGVSANGQHVETATDSEQALIPLNLVTGRQINEMRFRIDTGTSPVGMQCALQRATDGAPVFAVAAEAVPAVDGVQDVLVAAAVGFLLVPGVEYFASVTSGTGGGTRKFFRVEIVYL